MERGGTVVWMGDVPFYYIGFPDGTREEWGTEGSEAILGVSVAGWEEQGEVTISPAGSLRGLTRTWQSTRPVPVEEVTEALATAGGNAAAWLRNLCPRVPRSGLIRLWDSGIDFLSTDHLADLLCVTGIGPLPPIANFTWSPPNPGPGEDLAFLDLCVDIDGSIVDWQWSFGDGGTSTLPSPVHSFAGPGTFNVTLTVRDDEGLPGAASAILVVGQRMPVWVWPAILLLLGSIRPMPAPHAPGPTRTTGP